MLLYINMQSFNKHIIVKYNITWKPQPETKHRFQVEGIDWVSAFGVLGYWANIWFNSMTLLRSSWYVLLLVQGICEQDKPWYNFSCNYLEQTAILRLDTNYLSLSVLSFLMLQIIIGHLFIHWCVHWCVRSFIHSFIPSFVHLSVRWFVRSFNSLSSIIISHHHFPPRS